MKKIHSLYFVISVSVMIMASCRATQNIQGDSKQNIPAVFPGISDTTTLTKISWQDYFTDTTLISLIDIALKNNFDVNIALQHIEMARANAHMTTGQLFPGINASGAYSLQRFGEYTMNGASNKGVEIYNGQIIPKNLSDYSAGLQTSWEMDIWGKLHNAKKAAVARFLASVEGKNWVVTNLIADIAFNYYDLLALDNQLISVKEAVSLQDSALKLVIVQKEAGRANELAVKQFEAQLYNSKDLEVETEQKISESENNLNLLLGRFPQPIIRKIKGMSDIIPDKIKTGIPSDLLNNRPDIKQSEFELIAAKADVKAARAAFLPSLNITGAMGFDAYKTSLFFSPQSFVFNVLGNLSSPLVNRSAIRAEYSTAKAAQQEALYNYQKAILNGYIEVYNQLTNYKNRIHLLEMKTNESDILNRAVKTSIELFKTGRANYLEVLTVQQNSLQSQIELFEAQKQQCESMIGLYKALGGGWK